MHQPDPQYAQLRRARARRFALAAGVLFAIAFFVLDLLGRLGLLEDAEFADRGPVGIGWLLASVGASAVGGLVAAALITAVFGVGRRTRHQRHDPAA